MAAGKPKHAILKISADEAITGERKEMTTSRSVWVVRLTGLDGWCESGVQERVD